MNMHSSQFDSPQRPWFVRLLRWCLSRRVLQRLAFTVIAGITLLALFFAFENWRGQRALDRYVKEWTAKGERFDRAAVIPPDVPGSQNLAVAPFLMRYYEAVRRTDPALGSISAGLGPDRPDLSTNLSLGDWSTGVRIDLAAWQAYYRLPISSEGSEASRPKPASHDGGMSRLQGDSWLTNQIELPATAQSPARDVLLALSRFDAPLAELRAKGPEAVWRSPVDYERLDFMHAALPQFAVAKSLVQLLTLRAQALLADGQTDAALNDLDLMLRISDGLGREPLLISYLVRIATFTIALRPLWHGQMDHRWSESQLAKLQTIFERTDTIAEYRHAIRGERTCFATDLYGTLFGPGGVAQGGVDDSVAFDVLRLFRFVPMGWIRQNQLALFRLYQTMISFEPGTSVPNQPDQLRTLVFKNRWHPYNILAWQLAPAFDKAFAKAERAQITVSLAMLACGLERYRIANGQYPEQLEQISPRFIAKLPIDFMSGQPFRYRRTERDGFVLYSVGEDRDDDGGAFPERPAEPNRIANGDWVWAFPK